MLYITYPTKKDGESLSLHQNFQVGESFLDPFFLGLPGKDNACTEFCPCPTNPHHSASLSFWVLFSQAVVWGVRKLGMAILQI